MKIKRSIAILLLTFVNCTLLLHAVAPHHHDQSICCIIDKACESSGDGKCHDHEDRQHKHHDDTDCPVKYLFATNESQTIKADYTLKFQPVDLLCCLPVNDTGTLIPSLDKLTFRQKPFLISHYISFAGHTSGLRAPPVCC